MAGPAVADRHAGTARDAEEGRLMSDADRTLAVAVAYEWAIDVFESMDREEALDYLRRVAARQRQSYEREIEYARIAGLGGGPDRGPARQRPGGSRAVAVAGRAVGGFTPHSTGGSEASLTRGGDTMTRTRRSRDTQENRDARKAALVAYGAYGQTLNLKDLEAFRLAAERWRETAAETRDEEEWRRAKRFTRIAHQLTQLYTRRVFT